MQKNDVKTLKLILNSGGDTNIEIDVSPNMPLRVLHYEIQKLFGFSDQGYHYFALPNNIFKELIEEDVMNWKRLVGIFFKPQRYSGIGSSYKRMTKIEYETDYHVLHNEDTYYTAQKMLTASSVPENVLFDGLAIKDVFFTSKNKQINKKDIVEHLEFMENGVEEVEKSLNDAFRKNDMETAIYIILMSKLHNCPITDTLYYHYNDFSLKITIENI